ncbi:MAG TPA: serine/threonine-protein kinase [Kofleriaceae bacterium]|nr:serine/threonine-protein kinase [Kofleriaceae bacterium]
MGKYADEFKAGDRLGKYEIIRELATGGMATIYLARVSGTAGFEKLVVLKCILPSLARDRSFVNMFLDEARLAATLRHSNIADVFDVGVEDNTFFFAMEYIHGQNARTVRIEAKQRQMPIPLEVSLAIVVGTASALGYAHDRTSADGPLHLVHRDVSPSNVIVSYEGAVKLVDFGIARANLRRGAKTRTGFKRGKAPYMSPEQCRGEAIDNRSDLFSLGTMLYELTVGQRPFLGNSDFEVMESIVVNDPAPPSILVRGYPARLEKIVMRLLARSPGARYQRANLVVDELESFIAERSMLTSSYVVAKYLGELFSELATSKFERTITNSSLVTPDTREYPAGRPPTALMETLGSKHHHADDEPTAAFKRAEQLWTPELRVRVRTPGEEPSQTSAFHEPTRQDPVLPFDPIAARSDELLAHLDDDAPAGEKPQARAYRRVETLLHRALAYAGMDEMDKAVTAIELALDEEPRTDDVRELLQSHVETIVGVYEGLLEDPYRTPTLVRPMHELIPIEIEPRARLLLPWIDGTTSIRDLIARSGMQRLEAYHHLCQFLLRGIIN